MIVSKRNSKIKVVRRLQTSGRFRRKEQAFVAEGTKWLGEIILSEIAPRFILYTEQWLTSEDHEAMLETIPSDCYEVSAEVMKSASNLEKSEGVLTVSPILERELPEELSLVLIADAVSDPGNLGTMIRTAAAGRLEAVFLAPGCVDAYNPKVVRGAMGAHLYVGIHRLPWSKIEEVTSELNGYTAAVEGDLEYHQVDWKAPSSIVIGGEARGAGPEARKLFQRRVSIPIASQVESLNTAVAAAIIIFEALRQRRAGRASTASHGD